MRELIESWWNGSHAGMVQARVRLHRDGDTWSVEREGPRERYEVTPCADEAQARAELQRLMSEIHAVEWKRVDHLIRRASDL